MDFEQFTNFSSAYTKEIEFWRGVLDGKGAKYQFWLQCTLEEGIYLYQSLKLYLLWVVKKGIILGEVVRRYPASYDKNFSDIIEKTYKETAGI